jgi:hypothetical protein
MLYEDSLYVNAGFSPSRGESGRIARAAWRTSIQSWRYLFERTLNRLGTIQSNHDSGELSYGPAMAWVFAMAKGFAE